MGDLGGISVGLIPGTWPDGVNGCDTEAAIAPGGGDGGEVNLGERPGCVQEGELAGVHCETAVDPVGDG